MSSRAPQNVKLAIFSSQSCNDGKEMYKKALCTCKVVVLLILPYRFFAVLVAVAVVVAYVPCYSVHLGISIQ